MKYYDLVIAITSVYYDTGNFKIIFTPFEDYHLFKLMHILMDLFSE